MVRLTHHPEQLIEGRLMLYLILFLILLSGQTTLAQPRDGGALEIRVKDHRDAIDDFSKLEIILETVLVSPKSGLKFWQTGWKELKPTAERVDLTRYVGNRSATIFKGEIASGSFEAIHLKLKGVEGILKKGEDRTAIKNLVGPIKLSFSVAAKQATLIVLDLTVVDMSDHPPRGYELQLQGYELYSNGKLVEKIPPG